jgi:amidase
MLRAATSRRSSDEEVEQFQAIAAERGADDPSYLARMARGVAMAHRDWLQLHNERAGFRHAWDAFFRDWDVLICPAALGAAWPHDQVGERHDRTITVDNHEVPTTDQMFWAGFPGLVYLPAAVAPLGLNAAGLPLGVQVIAGHLEDKTAIEFCRLLADEIGGFRPPPGYD